VNETLFDVVSGRVPKIALDCHAAGVASARIAIEIS